MASLTDPWMLGPLPVPNRLVLAPLAGIGNWFVRLQAKRYGAGMAVSEMISSHAIHHHNDRTCAEMLRIDPREREPGPAGGGAGPIVIQLFGQTPDVMRSAAAVVAQRGADAIDLNMGCPVPKVCKTGAGAALLDDPDLAIAIARSARQGSNLPVTVKLRSGNRPGETTGYHLAHRLVQEAGVSAIAFHPRPAAVGHRGEPDYELARRLIESVEVPVILSGGMKDVDSVDRAFDRTGATAVMLARGALGDPWLFSRLLSDGEEIRRKLPSREEVVTELGWVIDHATDHMGSQRATRYMRKLYPWYVASLRLDRTAARALQETLQRVATLDDVRLVIDRYRSPRSLGPLDVAAA